MKKSFAALGRKRYRPYLPPRDPAIPRRSPDPPSPDEQQTLPAAAAGLAGRGLSLPSRRPSRRQSESRHDEGPASSSRSRGRSGAPSSSTPSCRRPRSRRAGIEVRTDHGQRPARTVHARAAPAARAARRAAGGRDPGRALGDRAGERLAAEHRPQPARRSSRIKRVLERERFDVLHLHEPMTPAICIAALALWRRCPIVATFHASGEPRLDAARACRSGAS